MDDWTPDTVAARFTEAAETARRLPPARVHGYLNVWPILLRMAPERTIDEEIRRFQPSPVAVDRMLETMRWMQWLEVDSRHILWMRAEGYEWKDICRRVGCDRSTAWRRWKRGLMTVCSHLSAACFVVF